MTDDAALLHEYADKGSQAAFTELVRRHIDLVYAAALRRTGGDVHSAADVSQHVFTALARNARTLCGHPALPAWLHTATRNAALDLMISEQRRKAREEAAATLAALETDDAGTQWTRLRPVLDAAVDELPEPDRIAVVLRFLERRPFAEIGAALRVSEDAARMRTDRALEKLRGALARRGVTSTATALAALVANVPAVSAPVGLAGTLAARALLPAGAAAAGGIFTSVMNLKIVTAVAVGALIVGAVVTRALTTPAAPLPAAESPAHLALIQSLRAENARLKDDFAGMSSTHAALTTERDKLLAQAAAAKSPPPPVTPSQQQQRTMLNYLRQISAARDQFVIENGRPPLSVLELVGVDRYIREVNPVDGEDYSNLPMSGDRPLVVTTAGGVTITNDPPPFRPPPPPTQEQKAAQEQSRAAMSRAAALGRKIAPHLAPAIEAYRTSNAGKLPPNREALIPYLATPEAGADLVEYIEAERAARKK